MRALELSTLAQWVKGQLIGQDSIISAVSTDSRQLLPASAFVALRGERFDGHDYVAQAGANGAVAVLVERQISDCHLSQVIVDDSVLALGRLAAGLRAERSSTVLALTGSNGKTTVKSLLHGILQAVAPTYANEGNRNNEIGMPLALIDEPAGTRYAIYEMGAGQPGDIAHLANIAMPQVALVNNIGPAHLQRMGSLLGIAETKGAIYDALPANGIAVINADDAFGEWFSQRAGARQQLRFGLEADADLRATAIRSNAAGSQFRLHADGVSAMIELPLPGRHNLRNALAAAAMAWAMGARIDTIAAGLSRAQAVVGRQTRYRLGNGVELIDDSYNANPASVAAAIATLAQGGGEAWLVLGDMLELGPQAAELHAEIGLQARAAKLAGLFTVGDLALHASHAFGDKGEHFENQRALIDGLSGRLRAGVVCLVKGSRGSRMDRVVTALRGSETQENSHAA
ncbi:MAG: UDP-N-acetylmuramoyl-tripeptide--D-alanyl-D-alanine ligase [Pseudomarimonas sp.]